MSDDDAARSPPAYRLGCPVWATPGWRGNLYRAGSAAKDFLSQYASVFGCVEGNSTFYALPPLETVDRWRESVPEGFHFCFKFPRSISHDAQLVGPLPDMDRFFGRLERLPNRLGPQLLQLPPSFGPNRLADLDRFLGGLPPQFRYAVEVRHPAFFTDAEADLSALLQRHGTARGLMDTRAVHAAGPVDATTIISQGRKPKVPWRTTVTSGQPFARIVGQNDVRATSGYLDQWAQVVGGWLSEGMSPHIFVHAPDDHYAPRLARAFHFLLRRRRPELPEHPPWPGEVSDPVRQLDLL